MTDERRTRRGFLGLLSATALGSMFVRSQPEEISAAALTKILAANPGARTIGEAFLRRFPAQAQAHTLVQAIGAQGATDPRAFVLRRIRDDFENGRVIVIEDWVLSETEARLCALVALG